MNFTLKLPSARSQLPPWPSLPVPPPPWRTPPWTAPPWPLSWRPRPYLGANRFTVANRFIAPGEKPWCLKHQEWWETMGNQDEMMDI